MQELKVSVREELEAPADVVWREIEDFGDATAWHPTTNMLEVRGKGAGAVRRFGEQGVPLDEFEMEELCEFHDSAERRFSYRHLTQVPGFNDYFRNYVATVQIDELPADRSAITWSCRLECEPGDREKLERDYQDLYSKHFIAKLKEHLAGLSSPATAPLLQPSRLNSGPAS